MEFLQRSKLRIVKIPSDDFQVTKEVICRQLLKRVWHLSSFTFPEQHYQARTLCCASSEHSSTTVADFIKTFPQLGVVAPLNALSFPFESVKEVGDYWCEVTVRIFFLLCFFWIMCSSTLFSKQFTELIYSFKYMYNMLYNCHKHKVNILFIFHEDHIFFIISHAIK